MQPPAGAGPAPGDGEHDLDDRPGDPVVVEPWLGAPARSYRRRPRSIGAVLDRAVARWPERTAFVDVDGTAVGYREFAERVDVAARSLRARGLQPGQAVAVASGNTLALATAVFACARAQLVLVGLNTRLAPPQWTYMLEHMGARLALGSEAFLDGLREAGAAAAEPLDDVLLAGGPPLPVEPPDEAATYAVVFTSGTTGRPKASQVVHRCSVHSGMSYQRVLRLEPDDVTAVWFPLYYISAMHAHVLPAMLAGAACVLVDTSSPREYVATLERHGVSWAYAVPSWWRLCLRVPELARERLPALTRLAAGGAPFPADLQTALRERLEGVRLLDVYGLSETHSPGCIADDDDLRARPGTVGRPLDCMEAEVRGEGGRALPAGEPGTLWLRGSLVTTGYAGDPAATAEAVVDGWFDTGDVARIDRDGRVTVLDRTKDMINRGGTKIFSAEVEELLRTHPAVEDAAVVGVHDALAGEAVAAFVVPRAPVTAAEVRAWVRERMADHAAPKLVELVEALPRNAVGKTDKGALRERLGAGPPADPAPAARQVDSAAVLHALAEPHRAELVRLLVDRQLPVRDLVAVTGMAQPLVSHHLRVLRDAGLVDSTTRAGLSVYRARPDTLSELAGRLQSLAARAAGTARTTPW
ncbi:MAG TPA: metalloregulator ArsR/SmtB family transcription factor [Mycobacteriales bacterium]|nr:metalloregulator ArsR/SmtB family transcription factor [Mycobacteriales bacterium]